MKLRSNKRLVEVMTRRNVSVRKLAEEAGLSGHGMIQQLRSGRRPGCSAQVANAIAGALSVKVDYLFDVPAPTSSTTPYPRGESSTVPAKGGEPHGRHHPPA